MLTKFLKAHSKQIISGDSIQSSELSMYCSLCVGKKKGKNPQTQLARFLGCCQAFMFILYSLFINSRSQSYLDL